MGGIYLKIVIPTEPVLSRVEGAGIHAIYASRDTRYEIVWREFRISAGIDDS